MKMRFTVAYILFFASNTSCFKVEPDHNNLIKKSMENTVVRDVNIAPSPIPVTPARPMLLCYDDETYCPSIPSFPWNSADSGSRPVALPLSMSIATAEHVPPSTKLSQRKRCGLDDDPAEYWFHNKIHTFGNTGPLGLFHATAAPIATFLIDTLAYDGWDVRTAVSEILSDAMREKRSESPEDDHKTRVLDLCCGVGMSTRALGEAFGDNAEIVVGVDTSPEMVGMAKNILRQRRAFKHVRSILDNRGSTDFVETESNVRFVQGNAERTIFPEKSFDVTTIWYGFHEVPLLGRYRILREARRVLQSGGTLCILDISPDYEPSPTMLAGEPYVLEYKKNIMDQLRRVRGFENFRYREIVEGHVGMWLLDRK